MTLTDGSPFQVPIETAQTMPVPALPDGTPIEITDHNGMPAMNHAGLAKSLAKSVINECVQNAAEGAITGMATCPEGAAMGAAMGCVQGAAMRQ